ncbi:MAG: helix-turn-helix domain-containing protein, partial [Caulobacteraceae bacterium]
FNLTVDEVALATKIRPNHIEAIESFDLDKLPARPFTVGYVRAYAEVLGLDAGEVVSRFRQEAPRIDIELRAPAGVGHQRSRRHGWMAVVAMAGLAAVVGWNFARHAAAAPRKAAASQATAEKLIVPVAGPAHLGAPLPAPPEAATPPVYETPGLAAAAAAGGSADAAGAAAAQTAKAGVTTGILSGPTGGRFVAAGAIYGGDGPGSGLVLQAKTPTSLVVRGQGGEVYFARQLAAGEAWRAPSVPGLTVDVGEPDAMEVFQAGASKGALTRPQTPLAQLAG